MDLCFPSKLGSILKEKNLLPYGSKFFPLKVDPNFRKGFIVHWEANRKSQKLLVFEKIVIKHGGSCSHFNVEVQNGLIDVGTYGAGVKADESSLFTLILIECPNI